MKTAYLIIAVLAISIFVTRIVLNMVLVDDNIAVKIFDYLGGGGALGVAVIAIYHLNKEKKNPGYFERQEIDTKDERSIQIRGKAHTVSSHITFYTVLAITYIFTFMEENLVPLTIGFSVCAVHVASFLIAQSYYKKRM